MPGGTIDCPTCWGGGTIRQNGQIVTCPTCNGDGEITVAGED
ncbi:hypothetical protein [Actinophytocola sediminis]